MRRLAAALILLIAPAVVRPAAAQQPLTDILSFLITNRSVPTGDFTSDQTAAEATRDTISRSLLVELATLPISSSTGGFSYRFNPSLGTVERATDSFGPFFVERALTSGRGQAAFIATYRYARLTHLDGRDLREGTFITTANKFRDEAAPFDVEALSLKLQSSTVTLLGNVGVTDRLDIGAAIPIVSLNLTGERVNTYRGRDFLQSHASANVAGLGDIALRAKYNLFSHLGSGLAAGADLRLPTGREEDLLGAGRTALKILAIGSLERGRVASHVNAGFTSGGVSNQIDYAGAVAIAPTTRLTISAELIGRRLEDLGRIREVSAPHPSLAGVDTIRLLPDGAGTTTLLAVTGLKWNVGGTVLMSAHVVFPLTDAGLTARFMPTIALDYSFDR